MIELEILQDQDRETRVGQKLEGVCDTVTHNTTHTHKPCIPLRTCAATGCTE